MPRPLRLLLWGLLLVVVAWFLAHLQPVTVRRHVGPEGEAVRWPLLAVERFARHMGGSARRLADPDALSAHPRPDETLIVLADGPTLGPPRLQALLDRVRAGGRLIIGLPRLDAEDMALARQPVFQALGVHGRAADKDCKPRETLDTTLRGTGGKPLQVVMDGCRWLGRGAASASTRRNTVAKLLGLPGEVLARGAHGVHLLRVRLGRGEVILASDLDWLTGTRPGEADHAELLWRLAGDRPHLLLMARPAQPPLHRLILDHLPQTTAALALLLVAWLWRRALRFGPVVPPPPPERRSLAEHIEAAARFLWERHAEHGLLQAVRRRVWRLAARRHPELRRLDEAGRLALLARLSGLETETLHRLLHGRPPHQRHEFTRIIRQLQILEEQIRS